MAKLLGLLLCLFGGVAGIGDLVKLDIKGSLNNNGVTYDAGHWSSISMSMDGSKVIGTSSNFIWTSTDGATTWTETSFAANEALVTPDGSKMFALSTGVQGEQVRVSLDDGLTWNGEGPPYWPYTCMATNTDGTKIVLGSDSVLIVSDFINGWAPPGGMPDMSWADVAMSGDGMKIAGVINGGKIWISNNGGHSFSEVG